MEKQQYIVKDKSYRKIQMLKSTILENFLHCISLNQHFFQNSFSTMCLQSYNNIHIHISALAVGWHFERLDDWYSPRETNIRGNHFPRACISRVRPLFYISDMTKYWSHFESAICRMQQVTRNCRSTHSLRTRKMQNMRQT